jgi:hypothetical protein
MCSAVITFNIGEGFMIDSKHTSGTNLEHQGISKLQESKLSGIGAKLRQIHHHSIGSNISNYDFQVSVSGVAGMTKVNDGGITVKPDPKKDTLSLSISVDKKNQSDTTSMKLQIKPDGSVNHLDKDGKSTQIGKIDADLASRYLSEKANFKELMLDPEMKECLKEAVLRAKAVNIGVSTKVDISQKKDPYSDSIIGQPQKID